MMLNVQMFIKKEYVALGSCFEFHQASASNVLIK